jgi:hypothetical protein
MCQLTCVTMLHVPFHGPSLEGRPAVDSRASAFDRGHYAAVAADAANRFTLLFVSSF